MNGNSRGTAFRRGAWRVGRDRLEHFRGTGGDDACRGNRAGRSWFILAFWTAQYAATRIYRKAKILAGGGSGAGSRRARTWGLASNLNCLTTCCIPVSQERSWAEWTRRRRRRRPNHPACCKECRVVARFHIDKGAIRPADGLQGVGGIGSWGTDGEGGGRDGERGGTGKRTKERMCKKTQERMVRRGRMDEMRVARCMWVWVWVTQGDAE